MALECSPIKVSRGHDVVRLAQLRRPKVACRLRCPDSKRLALVTAVLLDGKKLSQEIQAELTEEVADFIQNNGVSPTLAAILVGDDAASEVYVRNKRAACERVGIESRLWRLSTDVSQDDLLALITKLNKAKEEPVHGILVQLPLPAHIDSARILQAVSPLKDVDGFHADNVGRMVQGQPQVSALHAAGGATAIGAQQHSDRRPPRGGRGP